MVFLYPPDLCELIIPALFINYNAFGKFWERGFQIEFFTVFVKFHMIYRQFYQLQMKMQR